MRKRISQLIVLFTSLFILILSVLFALSQNKEAPQVKVIIPNKTNIKKKNSFHQLFDINFH